MSFISAAESAAGRPRTDRVVLAAVGGLAVVTVAVVFVTDGNVGAAIAPLAVGLVGLAIARLPLRHSLVALAFIALTLENPSESPAANLWQSPLYSVGTALLKHLNATIPIKALFLSGVDVLLLSCATVWIVRRIKASPIDARDQLPTAPPLRTAALACIGMILLVWAWGLLHSGAEFRFSLWQVSRVIYVPSVFLIYSAAARGPKDGRMFAVALVAAALLRALVAAYVRHLFPDEVQAPYATTHADSMLFADAFLIIVVMFFEMPNRRNLSLLAATLPVLTWGMIANRRRLVWVELAVALFMLYFITPLTRLKKRIVQAIALALPLTVIYAAIGWESGSVVFAPIHVLRSVLDSQTDSSSLWRDMENFNLFVTVRSNPVFGTGFGHGYIESIHLPDISEGFELWRYQPHNSILGLLAFAGILGFATIWLIIPLGIFFAIRNYRLSHSAQDRMLALSSVCIIICYVVHCYGDMGLGTWTSVFTVGPALALIAKQAVATGAWPLRRRNGLQPSHAEHPD